MEEDEGPLVDKPQYDTPVHIMQRPREATSVMSVVPKQRPVEELPASEEVTADITPQEDAVTQPMETTVTQLKGATITRPMKTVVTEAGTKNEDLVQADGQVCTFENWELWAEEVKQGWAVLPEVDPSPEGIELKDIQIPDPDGNSPEEVDLLKQNHMEEATSVNGKRQCFATSCSGGHM